MCFNLMSELRYHIHVETPAELPFSQPRNDDAVSTGRRASEKKRRVKMADLRNLIETRMFSKSERTLEKIGLENDSGSQSKLLENSVQLDPNNLCVSKKKREINFHSQSTGMSSES